MIKFIYLDIYKIYFNRIRTQTATPAKTRPMGSRLAVFLLSESLRRWSRKFWQFQLAFLKKLNCNAYRQKKINCRNSYLQNQASKSRLPKS